MSLALLSKRPSPSLCRDVNSHYPVTVAWGKTGGMAERKRRNVFMGAFFDNRGRESQYLRLFSGRCPTRKNAVFFQSRKLRKGGQATMRWAQQACSDLLPAPAPAWAGMWGILLGWGSSAGVQTSHRCSHSFFPSLLVLYLDGWL